METENCQEDYCHDCEAPLETENELIWGLCDACYYMDDFFIDNSD